MVCCFVAWAKHTERRRKNSSAFFCWSTDGRCSTASLELPEAGPFTSLRIHRIGGLLTHALLHAVLLLLLPPGFGCCFAWISYCLHSALPSCFSLLLFAFSPSLCLCSSHLCCRASSHSNCRRSSHGNCSGAGAEQEQEQEQEQQQQQQEEEEEQQQQQQQQQLTSKPVASSIFE